MAEMALAGIATGLISEVAKVAVPMIYRQGTATAETWQQK